MLEQLDSRALRRTDCYVQRFMRAGTYHYDVLPAFADCISHDRPHTIKVGERKQKTVTTQHHVAIRFGDGRFVPDHNELSVEVGDLVMWNCATATDLPYCIVGDRDSFASNRLVDGGGYTHAFGLAGEYRWRDAFGGHLHGIVRVRDPECKDKDQFARWQEALKKGVLVTIEERAAKPASVEVLTGQTVFFLVMKGTGVSITDERLLSTRSPAR